MNRFLLLVSLFMAVSITLCLGQSDLTLGRATTFSALAKTKITAKGPDHTKIHGNIGTSPEKIIEGEEYLKVTGKKEKGTELAEAAMRDANIAYEDLRKLPVDRDHAPILGNNNSMGPGVYLIDSDAFLNGNLLLDGGSNVNSIFVFLINGDFETNNGDIVISDWGASARNVYWVVEGNVSIGVGNAFQGNIIAKGDITFKNGASLTGRAISLQGSVNFEHNSTAMPIVIDSDLAVSKEAQYSDIALGAKVTYTITATNRGMGAALGVVVKEQIPSGLKFVREISKTRGVYDHITNQWLIGDMAVGPVETLKLEFEIIETGNIKNRVTIIGDNPDPKPDNDSSVAELPELPDLSLTKTVDGGPEYFVGDIVQYTITVTNHAKGAQANVNVKEELPKGLEHVSHQESPGTIYNKLTGLYNIPELAGNSSVTLVIRARLVLAGTVRNVATITARTPGNDKNPDNDEDDKEVVVKCPELTVELTTPLVAICGETKNLVFTATPVIIGATYDFDLPENWKIVAQAGNVITVNASRDGGSKKVTVRVTDQCGKKASADVTVEVTGNPVAPAISGEGIVCFNSEEGISLSAVQVEGLEYQWTVDADLEIVKGIDDRATVMVRPKDQSLAGGKVTLKVTNSCGFSSTNFTTLAVTPTPGKPTAITGEINLCESKQAVFRASAVAGATSYVWSFPGEDWIITASQENGRVVTVTIGKNSGDISVRAQNGCSTGEPFSKPVTVVEQPTLTNFALGGKTAVCQDEAGIVYTATEVPGATYKFAVTGGLQLVSESGNKATVKAGATNGTVSVTVTDFCGRELTVSKEVVVTPKLTTPIISGAVEVCSNSTGNTFTASAYEGTVTYKWTASGDLSITSADNERSVQVRAGALGGILTLEVSNGCFTVRATKAIGTFPVPKFPTAISGPANLCEGETRTYSVPAVAGVTYNWSVPTTGGWEIIGDRDKAEVRIKIGAASGSVELMVFNACGTNSSKVSLPIAVTNKPAAPAIRRDKTTSCIGDRLTFRIDAPVAGLTYTWAVPATWTASATTGTSIEVTVGSGSGDIRVYAANQCGDGAVASLAVAPTLAPATPGAINSNMNVCINSTGNEFSVAAVPGADSYEWELPAGWVAEGAANGSSIRVTATEKGGIVRVRAINGCDRSEWSVLNINITIPPAPVARITDNSNVCDGLTFTADPVAGATSYTWTVTEGFTIESGQGTTTIKVKANNPNAKGEVNVMAYNGSCEGSASFSIPVDASVADGQLSVPKAFSPNGDGKNDTWLISNLLKFPDNEVVIFNRWGSEVYKQRGYKNDWLGKGLEQGTYFYKVRVKLCDGVYKEFTGYVAIFR